MLARFFAVALAAAALVEVAGSAVGAAGLSGPLRGVPSGARSVAVPTAPPLAGTLPTLAHASSSRRTLSGRDFVRVDGMRRPAAVPLRDALARVKRSAGKRRISSATGATVTLLGDHNAYAVSNTPQISDVTLGWGEQVGFDCSNLVPNETNLNWILFPPDGSALVNKATVGTDAFGNCLNPIQDITLSTPYGSGTDAPYAGVWAAGLRRANGDYEAVTYFVVTSEPALHTYADGGLTTATRDFTAGQTMYVVANGLNPTDAYAIGWVATSVPPIKCVKAVPATFQALPNCFGQSVANAGVQAASGSFEASWDTSTAPAASPGTYMVQLYDVTQHHLVATQPVALQASGVTWTLTPYQGSTNGSTGLSDKMFAFDGFLDQAVTGLTYGITGAATNGSLVLTISDANGAVLASGTSSDTKHVAAPARVPVSGGSGTSGMIPFALNASRNTTVGPTALFNAANTMIAQLYDPIGGSVVAAQSFTLLAYEASFAWNEGSTVNAGAGSSCPTTATHPVTITNTGVASYGPNNGDGIVGIKINPEPGGSVTVCGGDASTTDPNGNTWNITYSGGSATATIAAGKPAALNPGQALTFNVILAAPSSTCGGPPCALQTQILPLHGLAYSGNNTASNGLIVGGKNNTSQPSYLTWAVTTGGSPGTGIVQPPPFTQMMYVAGTNGSTAGTNYYYLTAKIQNSNPAGVGNNINDVLFTFPTSVDMTNVLYRPSIVSMTTTGGTTISGWSVYAQNGTSNNVSTPNAFAIANGTGNSSSSLNPITPGTTAIVTLKVPVPPVSFALQQIAATANFDGGCVQNVSTRCTYASTALVSTGTQNSVAGIANVDSTELGVYSLDPTKMSGSFTPQTIGAGVASSSTFTFTNTPTSADPNPDYVDAINLVFPSNAQPSSIAAPAGWTVTGSGTAWSIALNACSPAPCQETGAIAPGATLPLTVTFPGTTVAGTYTVYWNVRGANGGTTTPATTASEGKSTLVVSPVAASVKFAGAGGYPTATFVTTGNEPTVGSDSSTTYGNAFDYKLTNNGSQTITDATITIPAYNRAGGSAVDSGGQGWQITGTPVAPGCTAVVTQPTTGTTPANGSIVLSGCSIAPGASIDVTFTAKAPYEIGSEFDWPATVCANHAQCSTLSVAAAPAWGTAEYVKVVVDARLSIVFTQGTPTVGAPVKLANPGPGGSTPNTVCPACSVSSLGATPLLDLGAFNGTSTFSDVINASVTSDAVNPNTWSLYVSIDANPTNGSGAKELAMKLDPSAMPALSGFTVPSTVTSAFFQPPATGSGVYPTSTTGTLLGTYGGAARRAPVDTIHSFQINNTGATGSQTVTLMWTLIAN